MTAWRISAMRERVSSFGQRLAKASRGAGLLAATALAFVFATGGAEPAQAQKFEVPSAANQYILDQTNAFRKSNGQPKLRVKGPPNIAADSYAQFLAEKNLTGHTADGRQPWDRLEAAQGRLKRTYCGVWENVHHSWSGGPQPMGWQQAMAGAMEFWRTSPDHKANMLRAEANEMGIGVHAWKHGDLWYYKAVQLFVQSNC